MKIGIIGVGGVGGYFGGKICRLGSREDEVYFVARGKHLDEIRQKGLLVSTSSEGEWGCRPTLATDRIDELPLLDVCLLCVKAYDLEHAVKQLIDKVSESTLIVPLLNGIDIYERIRQQLAAGRVFPACVYVGTHIEQPGKVTQNGGACKILLGKDPQSAGLVPDGLFALLDASRIKYAWLDNVYAEIWTKFMFIAAFGLVTAGFDKTLGEVMESQHLSRYVLSVMDEIAALSRKSGIGLPETIVADTYQKGRDFPYETKTSFQRDFERLDKPDERDLYGGVIQRMGRELAIQTPVTEEVWGILNGRKPCPR